MCVIAVSRAGERLPTKKELHSMWVHNPDGAGYMCARAGQVFIHKGFMTFEDFWFAVRSENFTKDDPVVFHFRISTQAGKTATMTHPFPFSSDAEKMEALDVSCPLGIAHNGIIKLTSDPKEKRFSDTALFIMDYLPLLIKNSDDLADPYMQDIIKEIGGWSKFAFMEGDGTITTIGYFTNDNGVLLSNTNHKIEKQTIPTKSFSFYRPAGTEDIYAWR